jgi:hypothetical protein
MSLSDRMQQIQFVMPGFMPGIHVLLNSSKLKTWMAGQKGVHACLRRAMPCHDKTLMSRPRVTARD